MWTQNAEKGKKSMGTASLFCAVDKEWWLEPLGLSFIISTRLTICGSKRTCFVHQLLLVHDKTVNFAHSLLANRLIVTSCFIIGTKLLSCKLRPQFWSGQNQVHKCYSVTVRAAAVQVKNNNNGRHYYMLPWTVHFGPKQKSMDFIQTETCEYSNSTSKLLETLFFLPCIFFFGVYIDLDARS